MSRTFHSACGERPRRLNADTRQFAWESLHGKYGDEARKSHAIALDDVPGFEALSPQAQYDIAIMKIAREAPLRICAHERVSGAATLGLAIQHAVPVTYKGRNVFSSVSHLTLDFQTVVFKGVDFLDARINSRLAESGLPEMRRVQLEGMKNVIRAMRVWHARYLDALKDNRPENFRILEKVPFKPAANFREGVQSIWFTFAFTRLCGNWPGIGRIDEMLGGLLKHDLAAGAITLDEARETLASMFIKGCEWVRSNPVRDTGDAQHYQNIVLAGINRDGVEITNEVTHLVLDVVEELGISDFPITLRISRNTPDSLLTHAAEVMRHGGGVVALYNEPLILEALELAGYDRIEARDFANDGCWEVQIPGKTCFGYFPFDGLGLLLNDTLRLNTDTPTVFDSYDALYSAYMEQLEKKLTELYGNTQSLPGISDCESHPTSVVSLFESGCIESGRSYYNLGPVYTVRSPHIGGAPDAGNSLFAIDRLVFKDKRTGFAELMRALKDNWEGHEELRAHARDKYAYYGNDNDEADGYTARLLNDFADLTRRFNDGGGPVRFPSGVSTFGRQINWLPTRCATPFGARKGEILAGNASPTPGTDKQGATAVIRSYCKADLRRHASGAALDILLGSPLVKGEEGVVALKAIMLGFVGLGGFFMQIDVADAAVYRAAQKDPEAYKTLAVRISGWSARFVTLCDEWQRMVIERLER